MHTSTAQAVAKTIVSPHQRSRVRAASRDRRSACRALCRRRRPRVRLHARRAPSRAGAAIQPSAWPSFLAALSRLNADEGRNPDIITDEFSSGAVAEHLNMTVADLAGVLRELEADGLVACDAPTACASPISTRWSGTPTRPKPRRSERWSTFERTRIVVSRTASFLDQACRPPQAGHCTGGAGTSGRAANVSRSVSMPTGMSSSVFGQRIMIAPMALSLSHQTQHAAPHPAATCEYGV